MRTYHVLSNDQIRLLIWKASMTYPYMIYSLSCARKPSRDCTKFVHLSVLQTLKLNCSLTLQAMHVRTVVVSSAHEGKGFQVKAIFQPLTKP
jgi:hypothetical protein